MYVVFYCSPYYRYNVYSKSTALEDGGRDAQSPSVLHYCVIESFKRVQLLAHCPSAPLRCSHRVLKYLSFYCILNENFTQETLLPFICFSIHVKMLPFVNVGKSFAKASGHKRDGSVEICCFEKLFG